MEVIIRSNTLLLALLVNRFLVTVLDLTNQFSVLLSSDELVLVGNRFLDGRSSMQIISY